MARCTSQMVSVAASRSRYRFRRATAARSNAQRRLMSGLMNSFDPCVRRSTVVIPEAALDGRRDAAVDDARTIRRRGVRVVHGFEIQRRTTGRFSSRQRGGTEERPVGCERGHVLEPVLHGRRRGTCRCRIRRMPRSAWAHRAPRDGREELVMSSSGVPRFISSPRKRMSVPPSTRTIASMPSVCTRCAYPLPHRNDAELLERVDGHRARRAATGTERACARESIRRNPSCRARRRRELASLVEHWSQPGR